MTDLAPMPTPGTHTVRLKVSSCAAGIIGPGSPREVQLRAAQGRTELRGADLLTVLCVLCASPDGEVKRAALDTLCSTPAQDLRPAFDDPSLHPRLLELLVRVRADDDALMARVIAHPAATEEILCCLAERAAPPVLERLLAERERLTAAIMSALSANPHATALCRSDSHGMQTTTNQMSPPLAKAATQVDAFEQQDPSQEPGPSPQAVTDSPEVIEEVSDEALAAHLFDAEQRGLTKYQLIMELNVSEKIKLAVTGDAEWRKLLIKDPNRVVHGAVLKNARITEAEVVMVARNKSASDEMVRLILLNREWMKNYEIRKALVVHPKTPLAKALRCISDLTLRDLKDLMRNRNISSAIAGTARREFERQVKRGG